MQIRATSAHQFTCIADGCLQAAAAAAVILQSAIRNTACTFIFCIACIQRGWWRLRGCLNMAMCDMAELSIASNQLCQHLATSRSSSHHCSCTAPSSHLSRQEHVTQQTGRQLILCSAVNDRGLSLGRNRTWTTCTIADRLVIINNASCSGRTQKVACSYNGWQDIRLRTMLRRWTWPPIGHWNVGMKSTHKLLQKQTCARIDQGCWLSAYSGSRRCHGMLLISVEETITAVARTRSAGFL